MGIGLDYTREISPAALHDAGASVVFRYLSWLPNSKVIGAAEYRRLTASGITVLLNWEYRATDWSGGATAGVAHANEAVRQARALGYPSGWPIIGSNDQDVWSTATAAYAGTYRDTIHAGGYAAGVYGATDTLDYCAAHGYGVLWQSMSTHYSGGRNAVQHPHATYWQKGARTVAGQGCDWSEILDTKTHPGDGMTMLAKDSAGNFYVCDGVTSRPIEASRVPDFVYLAGQGLCTLAHGTPGVEWENAYTRLGWFEQAFGALPKNPSAAPNPAVYPSAAAIAGEIIKQLGTSPG